MSGLQIRDAPSRPIGPGPAIDPRILARLVAVRQSNRRRHWRAVTTVLAVVTIVVVGWILARSPLLAVRHLEVLGSAHTPSSQVLAVAGIGLGRPMLDVNTGEVSRRIRSLPWVGEVGVSRHWPNGVTIRITERVPLAQLKEVAGQQAIVDAQGRVLATGGEAAGLIAHGTTALPLLSGVAPAGAAGTSLDGGGREAVALLQALVGHAPQPALPRPPSAVLRAPDGSLSAILSPGPISVVFGSADRLAAKLMAARSLLAQVPPGMSATIDVRVVDAPVLTNEKIGTMVSTTQRG